MKEKRERTQIKKSEKREVTADTTQIYKELQEITTNNYMPIKWTT